jgi:predicted GIY-YIG superfamily endonuclease
MEPIEPIADSDKKDKKYYVYILESSDRKATYVGATVDLNHRLRQHNKELAGGAHATSVKVAQGCTWNRICFIQGFPDWPAALQFEWRLKQLSRMLLKGDTSKNDTSKNDTSKNDTSKNDTSKSDNNKNSKPIERRIQALHQLLSLDKPTTKAIPYSNWPSPPEIIWEKNIVKN